MNTEQAYIEGFVKRAMEYGFSQNESLELLKEANALTRALARGAVKPSTAAKRLSELYGHSNANIQNVSVPTIEHIIKHNTPGLGVHPGVLLGPGAAGKRYRDQLAAQEDLQHIRHWIKNPEQFR